jgi:hypothetical protein
VSGGAVFAVVDFTHDAAYPPFMGYAAFFILLDFCWLFLSRLDDEASRRVALKYCAIFTNGKTDTTIMAKATNLV